MNDQFFAIDWSKVRPETIKLLESGRGQLINGVVRNVAENYQIVQHMPFEQVSLAERKNLIDIAKSLQTAQSTVSNLVAISSIAVMGSVIISTAYLSNKLDNIQKAIDLLQKEIHGQNLIYYTDRITDYFGSVEATRELINNNYVVVENPDLILLKLSELLNTRYQLLSFLDNLIHLSDTFSVAHKSLAIDFINMTFDLIPKGVFIESQTAYKLERFHLGNSIRDSAQLKYKHSIENYKAWANSKYHSVLNGSGDSNTKVFQDNYPKIKSLMNSEENKLLLQYSA